jgi:hypothetical protein
MWANIATFPSQRKHKRTRLRPTFLMKNEIINEIWKPVVGYEEIYSVSSLGNVRREKGGTRGARFGKILKPYTYKEEYPSVNLYRNNVMDHVNVHVLMAKAFLGPCPEGYEVNHKDAIKKNNILSNIEYVTYSENQRHGWKHGCWKNRKTAYGEKSGMSKLNDYEVVEIRALYKNGKIFQYELAKMFGVTQACINSLILKKTWKHVGV